LSGACPASENFFPVERREYLRCEENGDTLTTVYAFGAFSTACNCFGAAFETGLMMVKVNPVNRD
jgi:hypothetical protein